MEAKGGGGRSRTQGGAQIPYSFPLLGLMFPALKCWVAASDATQHVPGRICHRTALEGQRGRGAGSAWVSGGLTHRWTTLWHFPLPRKAKSACSPLPSRLTDNPREHNDLEDLFYLFPQISKSRKNTCTELPKVLVKGSDTTAAGRPTESASAPVGGASGLDDWGGAGGQRLRGCGGGGGRGGL